MSLRLFILNTVMPFTKEIGQIHVPFSRKLVTEDDVTAALAVIKPGMVFASRTDGELTTLLIPGWWKHNAMVAKDGQHVIEAVGRGVIKTGIYDFLMHKDYVVAVTPRFASDVQMLAASVWAEAQLGASYDYDFLPVEDYDKEAKPTPVKDRAFYCAKLPWAAYRQVCGPGIPFTTRLTLGVATVVPQDYVAAPDKWARVWGSASAAPRLASQHPPIRA